MCAVSEAHVVALARYLIAGVVLNVAKIFDMDEAAHAESIEDADALWNVANSRANAGMVDMAGDMFEVAKTVLEDVEIQDAVMIAGIVDGGACAVVDTVVGMIPYAVGMNAAKIRRVWWRQGQGELCDRLSAMDIAVVVHDSVVNLHSVVVEGWRPSRWLVSWASPFGTRSRAWQSLAWLRSEVWTRKRSGTRWSLEMSWTLLASARKFQTRCRAWLPR